jgi:hypothetical protein
MHTDLERDMSAFTAGELVVRQDRRIKNDSYTVSRASQTVEVTPNPNLPTT